MGTESASFALPEPPKEFRPTYREAKPVLDEYVEKVLKEQAGEKGDFKNCWTNLFLLSPEEATKIAPEQNEELGEVIRYIAKRLTWSTVNAPAHDRLLIDRKNPGESIENLMKEYTFTHDMAHALVALTFHPESNSLTPEFNRQPRYDLHISPQVFEEEMMASLLGRRLWNDKRENFFTATVRKGDVEEVRKFHRAGLSASEPLNPEVEKEWIEFYENKDAKIKKDGLLYFLEAYEMWWFRQLKRSNQEELGIFNRTDEERKLHAGMEESFRYMQAHRSPQYLAMARNIYDACIADPDHKDPMILWREFERLAAPILKKVRQRGKNESMETN